MSKITQSMVGCLMLMATECLPLAAGQEYQESTELTTASLWLSRSDEGKYGACWNSLAAHAKTRVSKEQWILYMRYSRQPLGKLKWREVTTIQRLDSLPNVSDLTGITIEYQSSFGRNDYVFEIVGLVLEEDGEWRVGGYLIDSNRSTEGTAFEYLKAGSFAYKEENYQGAADSYDKALAIEQIGPTLTETHLRILVDNLGISHAMLGDLQAARAVFEYGLKRDPTYPMFHYNMACVHAELKDLENTIVYLKNAFRNRENMIPGETIPNPRKDPSFKHYLDDELFIRTLEDLD